MSIQVAPGVGLDAHGLSSAPAVHWNLSDGHKPNALQSLEKAPGSVFRNDYTDVFVKEAQEIVIAVVVMTVAYE